jgi:hypothetical protein
MRTGCKTLGRSFLGIACLCLVVCPRTTLAGEPATRRIRISPSHADLLGPDAVQQVAVDGLEGERAPIDLTGRTTYRSEDAAVAEVDSNGLIVAKGEGTTRVIAQVGEMVDRVAVTVKAFAAAPPPHFANQVVPVFTKLGCNSGGCHGKASGQNGFRLSLLGFEPALDYETLVNEDRGRRIFPAAPARSLLLQKATGLVPHGGGKRMAEGSHEYRILLRWVQSGSPLGRANESPLDRIEIYPSSRRLSRGTSQQVVVTARYNDGRIEDVTRWAQYQSNDVEVADVTEAGQVRTVGLSGQAAIMARYQGKVAVFRATVPVARGDGKPTATVFRPANAIDRLALKQWQSLGIEPSDLCGDAEFIRRVSLDITGTLPTAGQTRTFVADSKTDKRERLVDSLLEQPEYANYFAIKWADILRNKRDGKAEYAQSTYRFHDWIRENLAKNVAYDRFVREILTASGTPENAPSVMWYRKKKKTDEYVDDAAQVFLGMRLQCAKCHHHPFEVWGQDDYYGFAAFFARVKRKPLGDARKDGLKEDVIFSARSGNVSHPKTGRSMEPRGLGDRQVLIPANEDPRDRLVDWMASPSNPYFARALVNRYWSHFFGRGIVEPLDDLRLTNPPSNPELLDALADSFMKSGYDLKALVRLIATSSVYSLSSIPNESNARDKQSFARHYPRRLGAEVLLDAISQVTGSPTTFAGFPSGTRAIELPDEGIPSGFLDAFGRPKRDTACECERTSDASLGQSLMLLNSTDVQTKLTSPGGRAQRLAEDVRSDEAKVAELFWDAFGRAPGSGEIATALSFLAANPNKKQLAYEDIIWALLNAKEFQFND